LIVTENGCSKTVIDSVRVFPKPVANFGLTSAISCILNPVQFNDSSIAATPLTYQWNFDDGNTSTLQNPVNTYTVVDTYDVTLIVTTTQGCKDTVELPAPLNVMPPPAASFTTATNCFTNEIDFTQTSTGGSTSLWNFGDLSTTSDSSSLYSPSYTYPDSGSYTVVLTVNPGTSCTGVQTTTFFVDPPLIPTLSPPADECFASNSFNFSPGGSYEGTGTFSWNFGSHATPASSSNGTPTNIIYDTIGTFPVSVTITENGCAATCSTFVNVYPEPEARFEIATTTGCALNPVLFMDDSQSDTPLTYFWDFGDGNTSTAQNPYATYAAGGFYTVTLEITTQHGCKDTTIYPSPLEIFPSPVAGFNVSPTYTSIFYPDVVMTDLSSGADSCEINWGDGYLSLNCDSMHTYTFGGTFNLMQVVANNFGCYDTAYAEVIVDPNYLFWIPNAFTPANHDGLNDVFKPKLIGVHSYSFMIFDRWGEKIFETDKLEEGWNGLYKDVLCQQDVYVYKVSFRDDVKGVYHKYIGRVTLVR
jgi:gliding motility-associated-like protein